MKMIIVAIYDSVSDRWLPPYVLQTKGQAIRQFMDEVNRPAEDNILYKHCDDFVLFEIGEYSDEKLQDSSFFDSEIKLIAGREAKSVGESSGQPRLKGVN